MVSLSHVVRRSMGSTRWSVEVWSGNGEGETRKPGSRADVDDRGAMGEGVLCHGTVEDVALPQDGYLARTDQPVRDPRVGQDLGEPLAQSQSRTEDRGCGRRGPGCRYGSLGDGAAGVRAAGVGPSAGRVMATSGVGHRHALCAGVCGRSA